MWRITEDMKEILSEDIYGITFDLFLETIPEVIND
jgi:hypothetical protein